MNQVPLLLKDPNMKAFCNRNKKQRVKAKKDYNHFGSFISHYLQHVENALFMSFYKFLTDRQFRVHTLCFDALTIDSSDERLDINLLKESERYTYIR